jgi:acyl-coenzyme A thioesterase PaaI-like protein
MVCHGGMLATFLDVALACSLRELPGVLGPLPTISMTLDYLEPAPCGTWIESRVTVPKVGGSIGFAQALLMGPSGPVLRGSGVYKRGRHVE